MRLWSLHPSLLDSKGLVALWREALLALKVLSGKTRGYTRHPQLERFRKSGDPVAALASYLASVHEESVARGFRFDSSKIPPARFKGTISVTDGQLLYEFDHLKKKCSERSAEHCTDLAAKDPFPHPLFTVVKGGIESWEKITSS